VTHLIFRREKVAHDKNGVGHRCPMPIKSGIEARCISSRFTAEQRTLEMSCIWIRKNYKTDAVYSNCGLCQSWTTFSVTIITCSL